MTTSRAQESFKSHRISTQATQFAALLCNPPHVYVGIYIYIYIYMCVCVCVRVYIHIHIHIYIHIKICMYRYICCAFNNTFTHIDTCSLHDYLLSIIVVVIISISEASTLP